MPSSGSKKPRTLLPKVRPEDAHDLDLSDLLGRPPVSLDTPELQRFLAGKNVLVTGAGGSIGSEICRQSMKFCPRRMILLDRAENNLFEIDRELRDRWVGAEHRSDHRRHLRPPANRAGLRANISRTSSSTAPPTSTCR